MKTQRKTLILGGLKNWHGSCINKRRKEKQINKNSLHA
ncbi:hypothetical protein bmyco0003_45060 [Bacillus pseudomycoides]|nr:hypothetical protein bmyco0002_43860 [Bacillus pseudomycoides]EEM08869.1 hypothetical protein bmyco0003_45060 [Bacillus pseudomycoides]